MRWGWTKEGGTLDQQRWVISRNSKSRLSYLTISIPMGSTEAHLVKG